MMLRNCAIVLIALSAMLSQAFAEESVSVVRRPETKGTNQFYASNRAPLEASPLVKLPAGSIKPKGWLRHQLELAADGMTGQLPKISPWLKLEGNGWADPKAKDGWEEFPYWIRAYGDLGYVLKDERIIKDTRRWVEAVLASQQPDGWFGPEGLRIALDGKPDMWPHMPVLNALQSYYEYTGDERVLKLMTKYFRWQLDVAPREAFNLSWAAVRFGDNLESVYWLYNRTGDAWLLDLGKKIHENSGDWTTGIANWSNSGVWHNVNVAEGFREPAEYWMQAKEQKYLDASERNYQLVTGIYGQFPGGGFAGDERCRPGYVDPRQGFETCGWVEFMHSFEMLTRITGNPLWADRCEEIAFNSLPAALTADMKGLRYVTCANVVQADKENKSPGVDNGGTLFSYSPYAGPYRCCQHNQGFGWPYYAEELWLATPDNGLCVSMYNASEVTAKVGDGTQIRISEETKYPFSNTVFFRIFLPNDVEFPLYLRVPRWSGNPEIAVNGKKVVVDAKPLSYVVIRRVWKDTDVLSIQMPMKISVRTWAKNKDSASVDYGPLTFSLKIGEKWKPYGQSDPWPEMECFATTPWNYGLVLDAKDPADSFELIRRADSAPDQPFTPDAVPMEMKAKARRIPSWTQDANGLLNVLPQSPVVSDEPTETVTLIPMGAARLRITAFPVIDAKPKAEK